MSDNLVLAALAAAVDELEEIGARAVAHPVPSGGWIVHVHHPDGGEDLHIPITPMEDGHFPGASAGHRLIEHGWIIRGCANFANDRTPAGWKAAHDVPGGWSAPVVPTEGT